MEIGGDLDDCVSTPEADELSLRLDNEKKLRLPKPGEVDFISGGPPCQVLSWRRPCYQGYRMDAHISLLYLSEVTCQITGC